MLVLQLTCSKSYTITLHILQILAIFNQFMGYVFYSYIVVIINPIHKDKLYSCQTTQRVCQEQWCRKGGPRCRLHKKIKRFIPNGHKAKIENAAKPDIQNT